MDIQLTTDIIGEDARLGIFFYMLSRKEYFSCNGILPQDIPRALMHQLWGTGWKDKWLNDPVIDPIPTVHPANILPYAYVSLVVTLVTRRLSSGYTGYTAYIS